VGGCGTFVVLVGRDGVQRWISAETQVALNRYFTPHDDTLRLPIFPILLEGAEAETLPAFLRLFQMTLWNGAADALPEQLLDDIRDRTIVTNKGPRSRVAHSSGSPPSASIRRTYSSGGKRRRWMRSPASIRGAAARPYAGWRSTATRARASPR
jgi:hypothetical protein